MLFICDTETSGLDPASSGIIEIACVAVEGNRILGEWSSLVWPGREHLQREHRAVMAKTSRIEVEELLDHSALSVVDARRQLLDFVALHLKPAVGDDIRETEPCPECSGTVTASAKIEKIKKGCPICSGEGRKRKEPVPFRLTSYNVEFDAKFLEAQPWQLSWWTASLHHLKLEWAPCVMKEATEAMGKAGMLERFDATRWKYANLQRAAQYLGIAATQSHRALADAHTAAKIAIKLGLTGPVEEEEYEL